MKGLSLAVFLWFFFTSSANEYHQRFSVPVKDLNNVLEGSRTYWSNRGQNDLQSKMKGVTNINKAKNVILLFSDYLESIPTVAAARMYTGKEENSLSFENFPYYGISKTYCTDSQVPDSACTATAYLSGVKTNYRSISVNSQVRRTDCVIDEANKVFSIAKWAHDACKGTGVVTTARITHASPAGVYAIYHIVIGSMMVLSRVIVVTLKMQTLWILLSN